MIMMIASSTGRYWELSSFIRNYNFLWLGILISLLGYQKMEIYENTWPPYSISIQNRDTYFCTCSGPHMGSVWFCREHTASDLLWPATCSVIEISKLVGFLAQTSTWLASPSLTVKLTIHKAQHHTCCWVPLLNLTGIFTLPGAG